MPSSNEVRLKSSFITGVDYVDNSLVITSGEDSDPPPSIDQDGDEWVITLDADRKNSEPPADGFNTASGNGAHEFGTNRVSAGSMPEELNFYFAVTVTLNFQGTSVPTRLYLGQGHSGTRNNWWIGGNAVVNAGTPTLLMLQNNVVIAILKISEQSIDTFQFTLVD